MDRLGLGLSARKFHWRTKTSMECGSNIKKKKSHLKTNSINSKCIRLKHKKNTVLKIKSKTKRKSKPHVKSAFERQNAKMGMSRLLTNGDGIKRDKVSKHNNNITDQRLSLKPGMFENCFHSRIRLKNNRLVNHKLEARANGQLYDIIDLEHNKNTIHRNKGMPVLSLRSDQSAFGLNPFPNSENEHQSVTNWAETSPVIENTNGDRIPSTYQKNRMETCLLKPSIHVKSIRDNRFENSVISLFASESSPMCTSKYYIFHHVAGRKIPCPVLDDIEYEPIKTRFENAIENVIKSISSTALYKSSLSYTKHSKDKLQLNYLNGRYADVNQAHGHMMQSAFDRNPIHDLAFENNYDLGYVSENRLFPTSPRYNKTNIEYLNDMHCHQLFSEVDEIAYKTSPNISPLNYQFNNEAYFNPLEDTMPAHSHNFTRTIEYDFSSPTSTMPFCEQCNKDQAEDKTKLKEIISPFQYLPRDI